MARSAGDECRAASAGRRAAKRAVATTAISGDPLGTLERRCREAFGEDLKVYQLQGTAGGVSDSGRSLCQLRCEGRKPARWTEVC